MNNRFMEAAQTWRVAPFPIGSSVEYLDEIHADLVLCDSWVADSVLLFLARGAWIPAVPDVLANLAELRTRLTAFEAVRAEQTTTVSRYLRYIAVLEEVYGAYLDMGPKKERF